MQDRQDAWLIKTATKSHADLLQYMKKLHFFDYTLVSC